MARGLSTTWESASNWDVLTAEGEWLGSLSMPARFTPYQLAPISFSACRVTSWALNASNRSHWPRLRLGGELDVGCPRHPRGATSNSLFHAARPAAACRAGS